MISSPLLPQIREDAPLHLDEAIVTPPSSPLEEQRGYMDKLLPLFEHPSCLGGKKEDETM